MAKTIRTISNISYNTPSHFKYIIDDLIGRRIIAWCYWIEHQADIDEKKDHIHFVLKPADKIDPLDLRDFFKEYDPTHPSKPLCCTTKWNNTNSMDDWLLYAIHDEGYLASKGQVRNIKYQYENIQTTDEDALAMDWNSIDRAKYGRLAFLSEAARTKIPFGTLVQKGIIPIAQRAVWEQQYNFLFRQYRFEEQCGRKESHEGIPEEAMLVADDFIDF